MLDIEREDYNNARHLWKDTRNAEATLAIFPKRAMAERKLLMFYSRNPGQHANAIKNVKCMFLCCNRPLDLLLLFFIVTQTHVVFVFSRISILCLEPSCL
jgi:hypothetical protein